MLQLLVAIAVSAPEWIEVRTAQRTSDDLTYVGYPEGPGVLWVGTRSGEAYRSTDNGMTWEWVFAPRSLDNLLDLRLRTLRVPVLSLDLLRDLRTDIPVRDRAGANRRVLDLAGQARNRQRETGARLLGIVVAQDVRDPGDVMQVAKCADYMFITARNGIWRSSLDNVTSGVWNFQFLQTANDLGEGPLNWVSCDVTRPGHLVATTRGGGMIETLDFGETWAPYAVPFERNSRVSFAIFLDGRIELLAQGRLYREREDRRGFEPMCDSSVDMVDRAVSWQWNRLGPIFATGIGGVTVCDNGRTKHYGGETMALSQIYYFQTQGENDEHVMIVTADEIYLSHDRGVTFSIVFRRLTESPIGLVVVDDIERFEDVVVWAGNTVWRLIQPQRGPSRVGLHITALERQAPLDEVVEAVLRNNKLDGAQIAARRDDARYQGLLPTLNAAYARNDGDLNGISAGFINAISGRPFDIRSGRLSDRDVWTVIGLWDLGDLMRSRSSTDRAWADVQRLHRRLAYSVQDAYVRWAGTSIALEDAALGTEKRVHVELMRREMAAYLDYMTGGMFPVFHEPLH